MKAWHEQFAGELDLPVNTAGYPPTCIQFPSKLSMCFRSSMAVARCLAILPIPASIATATKVLT